MPEKEALWKKNWWRFDMATTELPVRNSHQEIKAPTGTMQAVVIRAPMDFGLEEVPVPRIPEGGLLLKVTACGLCGCDLRTLRAGHHRVVLPWIVGPDISPSTRH